MSKKLIWGIIAILVVMGGYFYASPYLVLNSIKNAAQAGDTEKVSAYIDYPSVRQSFKDQVNAHMVKDMASKETNGWEALGAMMASAMVDKMVDAVITPEGMTLLLQGKDFKESLKPIEQQSKQDTEVTDKKTEFSTRYLSLNIFEATLKNTENTKQLKIILERDGLSWKVKKFVVPMNDKNSTSLDHEQETTGAAQESVEIAPTVEPEPVVLNAESTIVFDHSEVQQKVTLESCYHDPCSVMRVMGFKQLDSTPTESNIELTVVGGTKGWEDKNVEWNHEAHTVQFKCSITKPTIGTGESANVVPLNDNGLPGVYWSDAEYYMHACHSYNGEMGEGIRKFGYNVQDTQ